MELSSIPKQYGGELEWQWGEMPNADSEAENFLQGVQEGPTEDQTKKQLLKGPMLFNGTHIDVLGTENGKERRKTVPVPQTEKPSQPSEEKGESESESKTAESSETATADIAPADEKVAVNVNQVASEEAQTTTATA